MADPKVRLVRCRGYLVRASFCVRCLERNLQLIRVGALELIPGSVLLTLSPYLSLSQTAELNPEYFQTLDLEICRYLKLITKTTLRSLHTQRRGVTLGLSVPATDS